MAENARSAGHRAADWLERNSPDDVLDSVRRYARNPWTFMAICAGVGLSARGWRGMQAAKSDDRDRFDEQRYYSGGYQPGGSYRGATEEYPPRPYGQNQTTHGQGQAPSGQAPTTYGQAGNLNRRRCRATFYEWSPPVRACSATDAPGEAVGTAETKRRPRSGRAMTPRGRF